MIIFVKTTQSGSVAAAGYIFSQLVQCIKLEHLPTSDHFPTICSRQLLHSLMHYLFYIYSFFLLYHLSFQQPCLAGKKCWAGSTTFCVCVCAVSLMHQREPPDIFVAKLKL